MKLFTRRPISLARRALVRHLPETRSDRVRLVVPQRGTALRVLYAADAAFDYAVFDGHWHRLMMSNSGSAVMSPLHLDETASAEAVAAVIARDIAAWHRPIAYPLLSDALRSKPTAMQAAESEDRIAETQRFLSDLSRGQIPCATAVRSMADDFWNAIDDQIVDSLGDQKAGSFEYDQRIAV